MDSGTARVAAVTGGNRGIGREVACLLGQRGYSVILGSRDPVAGERTAAELGGDGGGLGHRSDGPVPTGGFFRDGQRLRGDGPRGGQARPVRLAG